MLDTGEAFVPAPRSPEPFMTPAKPDTVEIHAFADEFVLSRNNPEAKLSLFGIRRPGQSIVEVGEDAFEVNVASDLTVSVGGLKRTINPYRFERDGDEPITLNENTQTVIAAEGRDRGFVVGTAPGRLSFFTDFLGDDVRIMTPTGLFDE